MNKEHAQKLIERLADKTLSFGCRIEENNHSPSHSIFVCHNLGTMYSAIQVGPENTYHFFNGYKNPEMKILGHPVYIGDVLKKLQQQEEYIVSTGDFETINDIITREDYNVSKVFAKLLHHWARCGIENSLQTILDEAEWEGALSLIKVRNGCYELYRDKTKISEHSTISGANSMADKFPPSLKSPALKLFSYLNVLFPDK